ncbi:MAG: 50S ribosomal protein L24, partial [Thermoplasmataceae archaeon]
NVNLNKELRERYGVRSFPITKGDIVKVRSGKKKGEGGKVSYVDHRSRGIQVEGINIAKADGKEKQFLINPEKLIITKLDITDTRRLERIKEIATIKHKDITIIEKEADEQIKEAEDAKIQDSSEFIPEAEQIFDDSEETEDKFEGEDQTNNDEPLNEIEGDLENETEIEKEDSDDNQE